MELSTIYYLHYLPAILGYPRHSTYNVEEWHTINNIYSINAE